MRYMPWYIVLEPPYERYALVYCIGACKLGIYYGMASLQMRDMPWYGEPVNQGYTLVWQACT